MESPRASGRSSPISCDADDTMAMDADDTHATRSNAPSPAGTQTPYASTAFSCFDTEPTSQQFPALDESVGPCSPTTPKRPGFLRPSCIGFELQTRHPHRPLAATLPRQRDRFRSLLLAIHIAGNPRKRRRFRLRGPVSARRARGVPGTTAYPNSGLVVPVRVDARGRTGPSDLRSLGPYRPGTIRPVSGCRGPARRGRDAWSCARSTHDAHGVLHAYMDPRGRGPAISRSTWSCC